MNSGIQRIWKIVGAAWAVPAFLWGAEPVPKGLREGLGGDLYRERVEAEAKLAEWIGGNPARMEVVLGEMERLRDPEVRMRMREALKTAVVGEALAKGPGFVGIQMLEVGIGGAAPDGGGAIGPMLEVTLVVPGSAAEKGGLKAGDRILSLDGKPFQAGTASQQFTERVAKKRAGDEIELTVMRKGQEAQEKVKLTLMARPMSLPMKNDAEPGQLVLGPGMQIPANLLLLGRGAAVAEDPEMRRIEEERAREEFFRDWLRERSLKR